MALIECAESLSSSTKAKLQDAGILYVADVVNLLSAEDSVTAGDSDVPKLTDSLDPRAVLEQDVSQHHPWPPHLPRRSTISDTASGNHGDHGIADTPENTAGSTRSIFRRTSSALHFLSLKEGEVREIVDLALHATAGALGTHDRPADLTSKAQGIGSSSHRCTSSPSDCSMPTSRSVGGAHGKGNVDNTVRGISGGIPGCRTLREVIDELQERQAWGFPTHVTTFSREIDHVLGGGVPVDGVTEISGPPGVGKTQLLMQLAVSCTMPTQFGGLGGACLFVDTEGSFVAERLEQMATAAVSLVRSILLRQPRQSPQESEKPVSSSVTRQSAQPLKKRQRSPPPDTAHSVHATKGGCTEKRTAYLTEETFTVESVLKRVHYVRVTDLAELIALLYSIEPWLEEERTREDISFSSKGMNKACLPTSKPQRCSLNGAPEAIKMILIDSIALPFRSFEGFQREGLASSSGAANFAGDRAFPFGGSASINAARDSPVWQPSAGLLSKHGLWQRSRLLFQVSTLLEHLASVFHLTVLVTNHLTTKTLRETSAHGFTSRSAKKESHISATDSGVSHGPFRQSILVPALGDAWGHGLSTRLLLSYHHYNLPVCGFVGIPTSPTAGTDCTEDIVYCLSAPQHQPSNALRSVVQHRVLRLLKCSGRPRQETCFLVTCKGIRDVRKDMVSQRVSKGIDARRPPQ